MRDFVRMPLNRFSFGCFFITIIRTWCVAAQQLGAKPAPSCRTKNRCFTTNLPSSAIPTIEKNEKRGFTQLQGKRQPRAILTNSGRLGCVARVAGGFGSDVPGEKLVDLIDRVLGDAGQHVSQ